jgi:hypothetical protein
MISAGSPKPNRKALVEAEKSSDRDKNLFWEVLSVLKDPDFDRRTRTLQ